MNWKNDVSDTVPSPTRGRCCQIIYSMCARLVPQCQVLSTRTRWTLLLLTASAQPALTITTSTLRISPPRPAAVRTAPVASLPRASRIYLQAKAAPQTFPTSSWAGSRTRSVFGHLNTKRMTGELTRYGALQAATVYLSVPLGQASLIVHTGYSAKTALGEPRARMYGIPRLNCATFSPLKVPGPITFKYPTEGTFQWPAAVERDKETDLEI